MEQPRLKNIIIEITNICSLSCKHCSNYNPSDERRDLDTNTLRVAIEDFVSLGGQRLQLSGGEPLRHPRVYEIIEYAKNKNLTVEVFTCGVIGDSHPDLVARKLVSSRADEISVTLHGSYFETHDDVTGMEGSFERTVEFIKALVANDLKVNIHFVPTKMNFTELDDVIDFSKSLGAKEVQILRFVPQGRGWINRDSLHIARDEFSSIVESVTKQLNNPNIKVSPGTPFDFCFIYDNEHKAKVCKAGVEKCVIKVNGDVIPCPAFSDLPESFTVAGNVFKDSLVGIWRGSHVFQVLRSFDHLRLKGKCSGCKYLSSCQGRCPAQRIRDYSDMYKGPDSFCPLTVRGRKQERRRG